MQKQRQDAIAGGFLGDMYSEAAQHPAQHPPRPDEALSERDERVRELMLCAATGASCVAFGLELDLGHAWRNSPSCWLYSRLPDAQEELHDDDAATTQSVMCRKLE